MDNPNQNQQSPQKSKEGKLTPELNKKISGYACCIFLITALVVGGVVFAWQRSQINKLRQDKNVKITSLQNQLTKLREEIEKLEEKDKEVSEESDQAQIPTDWETYTNEKYQFEVAYPPEWSVELDENGSRLTEFEQKFGFSRVYSLFESGMCSGKEISDFNVNIELENNKSADKSNLPTKRGVEIGVFELSNLRKDVYTFKNHQRYYMSPDREPKKDDFTEFSFSELLGSDYETIEKFGTEVKHFPPSKEIGGPCSGFNEAYHFQENNKYYYFTPYQIIDYDKETKDVYKKELFDKVFDSFRLLESSK